MFAEAPKHLSIDGAVLFAPERIIDDRGWTGEIISPRILAALGIDFEGIQENQSFSPEAGIVRGLHFQRPPFTQAKIVRVAHGDVLSIVLDLRAGRPSFETSAIVRQRSAQNECLYVPAGCAHGIAVLAPSTVLNWTSDAAFDASAADGVRHTGVNLPDVWRFRAAETQISMRDAALPTLADHPFRFDHTGRHAAG